jgi:hypothetical protein
MSTKHHQLMAKKLIQHLRLHGYSDAYVESKTYQHYGSIVGLKFIVDQMEQVIS